MIKIANAAGFLGDWLDAPRKLVESAEVDFLTLEYLAELTLSILARQREKNPQAGYARDFIDVLESLTPALVDQPQLRIVTNAGGMNPLACARAAAKVLEDAGLGSSRIGVVTGDDLIDRLDELQQAGCEFAHFDDGRPLAQLGQSPVSANAYLGAQPIAAALTDSARIVITGRVADASLTVGPAMHAFGWGSDDWNRLAAASVAGHLIECGAQVTGGYSTQWQNHNLAGVGYPIAELEESGECVITKPAHSDGIVNRQTVVEQLVYEIDDPAHYLTPDVDVDFTTVEVDEEGSDRVRVSGATGGSAPNTHKVSLAYRDGYTASGQLLVYGDDCLEKARACGDIILTRLADAGFAPERSHVELLGAGDGVPGRPNRDPREVVLRVAVADPRRAAVERFTKEIAPLITSGPAGLAGYAAGRPAVRQVFAYWPTTIEKEFVEPQVEVRAASEWAVG